MNLFDDLNEKNYVHYAMKYYMNTQCTSVEEFNEDLNKVKYVKRLFNRFLETGELRTNLIMNHLIRSVDFLSSLLQAFNFFAT